MSQLRHSGRPKGYALIAVLLLMLGVVIYSASVQVSTDSLVNRERTSSERAQQSVDMACVVEALTKDPFYGVGTHQVQTPGGQTAEVTIDNLSPGHPVWARLGVVHYLPGDRLVDIELPRRALSAYASRFIINQEGRRAVPIAVPTLDLVESEPSAEPQEANTSGEQVPGAASSGEPL